MCRTYNREGQDKYVNVVSWRVYWFSKVVRLSRRVELNIFWFSLALCCGGIMGTWCGHWRKSLVTSSGSVPFLHQMQWHWCIFHARCSFCPFHYGDLSWCVALRKITFSTNILADMHIPVASGLWIRSAAFWLYLFCNLDGSSFNETPLESLDFLQAEIRKF